MLQGWGIHRLQDFKVGGAENGTEKSKYSHQDKKEDCIQQQECQQQYSVFIVQDKGEAQYYGSFYWLTLEPNL